MDAWGWALDDLSVELETRKLWPLSSCKLEHLHASGTAAGTGSGSDIVFRWAGDLLSMRYGVAIDRGNPYVPHGSDEP